MSDPRNDSHGRERRPIRVILPDQGAERRVSGGGSPPRPFRTVDTPFRQGLLRQLSATKRALFPDGIGSFAVPARVEILTESIAKSHRPETLFSTSTCPVIGVGKLGELFIKATPSGIAELARLVETGESLQLQKEISSVEAIEPITSAFRLRGMSAADILRQSRRTVDGFTLKVRLFSYGGDADEQRLIEDFEKRCAQSEIHIDRAGYSLGSHVVSVRCMTVADVEVISSHPGVRAVSSMPIIRTVRPRGSEGASLPQLPERGEYVGDVPVVAVVDSGVSETIPGLESWIVGRESFVAPEYRNPDHGTFVAGLVCWGHELNPDLPGIDDNPCSVYDFQVIPNNDPANGDVEFLDEQEFLMSLDGMLQSHANEIKVWNLSIGTDDVCSLDEFSSFAEELDNLQEKYGVSFVVSAGNYNTRPLLSYPRDDQERDRGRITTPADSILGIAVGSISHVEYERPSPMRDEPTPYSRHGAGPNYVIKPDLVHYGGACSKDGSQEDGIVSVSESGTAANLGTSFSTPLVSRTLARIYHQVTPTPTPVLAKALLIHHARDPREGGRVPDREEDFFGFGRPATVPYCLECTPSSSTLVFDDVLRPGYFLEWDDFPYPPSLSRNGRYYGEIWMTVAFAPARGARWGSEYCETHIDAHFGVFRQRTSRRDGSTSTYFKGLVPPEHKNPGVLYESYQIAKLRKWAPVRTYHGDLGQNGERGDRWRLKVQLLTRHGHRGGIETTRPQPFSLVVTIADPGGTAPVYDEMVRAISSRFQSQSLSLRPSARVRTSTEQ